MTTSKSTYQKKLHLKEHLWDNKQWKCSERTSTPPAVSQPGTHQGTVPKTSKLFKSIMNPDPITNYSLIACLPNTLYDPSKNGRPGNRLKGFQWCNKQRGQLPLISRSVHIPSQCPNGTPHLIFGNWRKGEKWLKISKELLCKSSGGSAARTRKPADRLQAVKSDLTGGSYRKKNLDNLDSNWKEDTDDPSSKPECSVPMADL